MRPRTKIITAAAVTTAILTAAAIVILATGGAPPAATTQPAQASGGQCPPAATDDTIPAGPPPDLRWKSVGPWQVPTSATAGPARYDGPLWECFAHTPMGAVLAAYDILAGLASPDWRTVAEHQAVPGPGQQAFIAAGERQTYQAPAPGDIPPAVGFQVASYTPRQATVEALSNAGEDYQGIVLTVAWDSGDWKMVLTPDGSTGPDPQMIASAGGFTMWATAANGFGAGNG
jgi:hypothetical protein